MSAYMCDRDHIRYLIEAAMGVRLYGRRHSWIRWRHGEEVKELRAGDYRMASEVGQMLWDENFASVSYRYDCSDPKQLPGPNNETYIYGEHKIFPRPEIDPAQVLKSCHCYAYQTCEHPGWETSEAKAFIDSLQAGACRSVTGYEDAEWGAPKVQERARR